MPLPAPPSRLDARPVPADPAVVRVRPGRGRRPTDLVRAEILAAAGEVLLQEGMAAFTIDRVAAQAGASKTTIYKWWPSKGMLAFDGFFHASKAALTFPDTGDIEVDLVAQVRAFVHLVSQTRAGQVLAELIGQAQTDPDLSQAFLVHYVEPRRQLAVEAMRRAQARGQLRADVELQVAVDQLWGACYYRLLIPALPLGEDFAAALVHNLLRGLRPKSPLAR